MQRVELDGVNPGASSRPGAFRSRYRTVGMQRRTRSLHIRAIYSSPFSISAIVISVGALPPDETFHAVAAMHFYRLERSAKIRPQFQYARAFNHRSVPIRSLQRTASEWRG
jgi:hypothetical protein